MVQCTTLDSYNDNIMAKWQRYRYVANKGTLHLDHIYLDVMRSVIKKLWKL